MAHSIAYEAGGGAYIRYWGDVTLDEVAAVVRRGQAMSNFTDRRYSIHDFTDVEHFSYAAPVVESLAATDCGAALSNRRLKVLVVTTRPEIEQMVRDYRTVGVPVFPVQIVASMDAARSWLAAERL